MLACPDDLFVDLEVEVIGGAVVHNVDLRVGEQLLQCIVAFRYGIALGFFGGQGRCWYRLQQ